MLDQAKDAAIDVVGKAQDVVGSVAGDAGIQLQGKARQAAGKARNSYSHAVSSMRDATVSNPMAALAVVAGIGFMLGAIWSRRD